MKKKIQRTTNKIFYKDKFITAAFPLLLRAKFRVEQKVHKFGLNLVLQAAIHQRYQFLLLKIFLHFAAAVSFPTTSRRYLWPFGGRTTSQPAASPNVRGRGWKRTFFYRSIRVCEGHSHRPTERPTLYASLMECTRDRLKGKARLQCNFAVRITFCCVGREDAKDVGMKDQNSRRMLECLCSQSHPAVLLLV